MSTSLPPSVTLLSIDLENFRNFASVRLSLDARGAVLEAPNGRGKTNFLEAIHYLNFCRSFRGAPDAELISFGASGFRVRGEVTADGGLRRRVAVAVEGPTKRLAVDEREVRLAQHMGAALSVILSPSDIRLVQGSPSRRRRYLDQILALSSRRYLSALQSYRRVLDQRNRLLQGGAGARERMLLEPWSEQLVRHGSLILDERRRFLARWEGRFAEISARLAGSEEGSLAWRYESLVPVELSAAGLPAVCSTSAGDSPECPPVATIADALREEIDRRLPLERRRGMTLVGPHRDDLSIRVRGGERDLRKFGSQGEQRTAALALRFLECEVLARERGELPIVLLDDVFSELDPCRSRELLGFLSPGQQVFLTTPKPLSVELPIQLPRYTATAGTVRPAA